MSPNKEYIAASISSVPSENPTAFAIINLHFTFLPIDLQSPSDYVLGHPIAPLSLTAGAAISCPREVAMTLPNEADIKCPKCADIMIISKIEGIEVEKCIGCKGIFLDGGEIDKIRERIRQRGEGGGWGIGFIKNLSTF